VEDEGGGGGGEEESWRWGCAGVIEREKTLCCTRDGGARGILVVVAERR